MSRRPLRVATTRQLERPAREAGFDVYVLPQEMDLDFHRAIDRRLADGAIVRPFLERHDIELVVDFNTEAMTFSPTGRRPDEFALTTACLGLPYVACFLDPITSVMNGIPWADRWRILESPDWVKWVWETAHADELRRLGVSNVVTLPMAVADDDFDTSPPPESNGGPAVAFMGHPASSWFSSGQQIPASDLVPGFTAAAVNADLPDLPFHRIYYDLYEFADPPRTGEQVEDRAAKSLAYFNQKFVYNAYLAVRQRDRFARFLKLKLGDAFELIGDHWQTHCGLAHTPRIWDMRALRDRMRRVPICLNLMKGCLETGLNFRHFEVTGYGGFMLTYHTPELDQCFEIGKECDVFRNEVELLEKINYYLSHDEHRREIAAAGQRRTLADHLFSHRLLRLVEILRTAANPTTSNVRADAVANPGIVTTRSGSCAEHARTDPHLGAVRTVCETGGATVGVTVGVTVGETG